MEKIKTPFDSRKNEYRISFIPETNAKNLLIDIRIGSDDDNLSKAKVAYAECLGEKLNIKNDMVELGSVKKNSKTIFNVKLDEQQRKTLEVRAYAEC